MAVTKYELVYKDGAPSGASLVHMYWCNNLSELPTYGIAGDLAYVAENKFLYFRDDTRWVRIITEYHTDFYGGIGVDGHSGWPSVKLMHTQLGPEQAWFALSPDSGYLTWNSDVGGNPFNASKSVVILALHNSGYFFNTRRAGSTYSTVANIDLDGKIYERKRSFPMGEVQYRTPSAGNFWGSGSMAVTNVTTYTYQFSLIGNTYTCNWLFNFNTSGTAGDQIYMHIPGSELGLASLRNCNTTCTLFLWGFSMEMGHVEIGQGNNFINIYRYNLGTYPIGGAFRCSGSFTFMV